MIKLHCLREGVAFRYFRLLLVFFRPFTLVCFRIKLFYLFGLEPAPQTAAIQDTEQQERLQNRIQDLTNQVRLFEIFLHCL